MPWSIYAWAKQAVFVRGSAEAMHRQVGRPFAGGLLHHSSFDYL